MNISNLALLAKKTIEAAWLIGPSYDLATQAAEALESAQLLQSLEIAAELHAAGMLAAAGLIDERPDLDYGLDFAELIREKALEKGSRATADATPAEFFRPGRTYTRDLPFRAPEDRPGFECVGVGVHPSKGAVRAFGFEQPGRGQPWVSASQRTEEWAEGWVDLGPTKPDRLTRTFAPTQALREEDQDGVPALAVYRAYDGALPLGTYTSPAAARTHCEAAARRKLPTSSFAWISDPDGGGDLVEGDTERPTGYVVTSLKVTSEYDPEADE